MTKDENPTTAPSARDSADGDETVIVNASVVEKALARASAEREREPILTAIAGRGVGRTYEIEKGENIVGRNIELPIVVMDTGLSRQHASIIRAADGTCTITDLGSTNGTFVGKIEVKSVPIPLREGDHVRLGSEAVLRFGYENTLETQMQRRLYDAATRDALTRAFNRRYFDECLSTEWSYAKRWEQPCALIMFDLDHFKNVNDTYGHVAGDLVLVEVAKVIQRCIRNEDVFARLGGEEFIVLARNTGVEQALVMAGRLREAVEELKVEFEGQPIPVTSSFGVSISADVDTPEALVAKADEALYEAKNAGRNCVMV